MTSHRAPSGLDCKAGKKRPQRWLPVVILAGLILLAVCVFASPLAMRVVLSQMPRRIPTVRAPGLQLLTRGRYRYEWPAWSPDGRRIAFQRAKFKGDVTLSNTSDICVIDLETGEVQQLTDNDLYEGHPSWSPDGRQIAFEASTDLLWGRTQIYIMDADGGNVRQLTSGFGEAREPAWSPDGSRIAFVAAPTSGEPLVGPYHLYVVKPEDGAPQQLTSGSGDNWSPAWSPDGKTLVVSRLHPDALVLVRADGSGERVIMKGFTVYPTWSPDGQWIALCLGRPWNKLFTIRADGTEMKPLFEFEMDSSVGQPDWSPDSAYVVFVHGGGLGGPTDLYTIEVPEDMR